MADETVLNLFVSSPGDVQRERERVDLVVERLNAEFAGRARIRAIRWETRYYSSHETFQAQIPEAAACDLVVAIFGARLGSPLPPRFPPMPTGEPYPSGTAYEVLTAIEARREHEGVPDVYVFRRPQAPLVALDAADRAEIEAQWRRLTDFFEKWFRSRSGEFLAAFQEFSTTDEFAAKIEDCLRQWLARRGFVAKSATWDRARLGSPYPGLAAFDASRQSVFFGRGLVVDQAIRRLREIEAPEGGPARAPFLLLIGASGSGKSSLLRAGLAPRLLLPGVFPEIDLWRRAIVVPGADPFASLAEALLDEEALGPELAEGPFRAKVLLARQLAGDPEAALAILSDALDRAAAARQAAANFEAPLPARLLLGVDQAERLLIECEPRLAERFSALIAALARSRVAAVVMALRSDAYPRFQAIEALVGLRDAGATLDLLSPTASELEEMTTRPAALCDPPLAFERRDGASLAETLIADARGGDALPLLQMTLSRLASAEAARGDGVLRFADYRGMAAAVSETADEALAHLDAPARAELPNLIAGLVRDVVADPLTGAPTPAIGALDRVAFEAGRPERAALIEAFVAERLLTAEGDAASGRVRPTHEALLRIWPEATAIIAEAAQLIRVRRALEPIAREWAEAAAEDKARHLDVSPALLEGAERCVQRFADAIAPATRDFVAAASAAAAARRDRELAEERRRLADAEKIAAANKRIARRTGLGLVAALALAALAGWQWQVAQQQRDRAQNTLRLATETANDLIFDVAQKFRGVSGVPTQLVEDVLDEARKLQGQLIQSGESTPALKASQAAAFGESARTLLVLGDTKSALDLAGQARDLYVALIADAPANLVNRRNLTSTDETIGDILQRQGDLAGATTAYQRAQSEANDLAQRDGGSAAAQSAQSLAFANIGEIESFRGELNAALADFRSALAIAQKLADASPNDVGPRNNLAQDNRRVGDALLAEGDVVDAVPSFDAARAIAEKLAADNPTDVSLRRDASLSDERLGESLSAKGDYAAALKAYQDGEAVAVALAAGDPDNLDFRYDLAVGYLEIGQTQAALGDLADALASERAALAVDQALVAHDASNAVWRKHLFSDLYSLGDALSRHGEAAAALDADRQALALAQDAAAKNPGDVDWLRDGVAAQDRIGEASYLQGDYDAALAAFQAGLTRARALAQQKPQSRDVQDDLAATLTKEGGAFEAKRDFAGALDAFQEAVGIRKGLIASDAADAVSRSRLAANLTSVGLILEERGKNADAADAFRESLALAQALLAADAANPQLQNQAGQAGQGLGDALADENDAADALAAYRGAADAERAALAADPANLEATQRLAYVDNRLADALADTGDLDGALAAVEEATTKARALAGGPNPNAQARDALVTALNAQGGILTRRNDAAGAKAAYAESQGLAKALVAEQADNVVWRIGLEIADVGVGDASAKLGDSAGAIAAYRDEAADLGELMRLQTGQVQWARDLGDAQRKLADLLKASGDADGALAAAQASHAALTSLPDSAPDAATWRRELDYVDNLIGALLLAKKDTAGAVAAYRESLATIQALLATDPNNALWRDDRSFTETALGDALVAQGDATDALAAYRDGFASAQALAADQPGTATYLGRLVAVAGRLGALLTKQGDRAGALAPYVAAHDAAAALVAADPKNAAAAASLKFRVGVLGALANLDLMARDYDGALVALDHATPMVPDQNWLDLVRAACLMFKGETDAARALYLKHRGEPTLGKTWEQATLDGFALLRAAGQSAPLMDEIATAFAAPG